MAQAGYRTAVVERQWIGGSCSNIACPPSKNEICRAKVVQLVRRAAAVGMRPTLGQSIWRRRKCEQAFYELSSQL